MKKRLLITSIVMMLVIAVALSTATYAWFTSNASVTASTVTMTAGTSGSTALGIAWTKTEGTAFTPAFNSHYGTTINTYSYNGDVQPAAPDALENGNAAPTFYTANINAQGEFLTDGTATSVFRFANNSDTAAQGYSGLIHVANLAQSGTVGVKLTASISAYVTYSAVPQNTARNDAVWYTDNNGDDTLAGNEVTNSGTETTYYTKTVNDGSALVRIAIFEVTANVWTYKGTIGKTAGSNNTAVGSIDEGDAASDLLTGHNTTVEVQLSNLDAQTDQAYAVFVWLDGALFDEAQSGKKANVDITFVSTAPTV